jgi:hypothetical protein
MQKEVIVKCIAFVLLISHGAAFGESSNRNQVREQIDRDGWRVAWGKNITEADWAQASAAVGISISTGNSAPFLAWFDATLQENVDKITSNLKGLATDELKNLIISSLRGKRPVDWNGFQLEAGIATYDRWQEVIVDVPDGFEFRGIKSKVRMKRITNKVNLPNWHQFYVRYRFKEDSRSATAPKGKLVANRTQIGPWEQFEIFQVSNDQVALRSHHGFLSAQPDGRIESNRSVIGPWETVTLVPYANGGVALRSTHGKYLSALEGGGGGCEWNRDSAAAWEEFVVEQISPGNVVLRTKVKNTLLTVEPFN